MQRQQQKVPALRHAQARAHSTPDLRRPGKEHQHVAIKPFANQFLQRRSHVLFQRLRRNRGIADRGLKLPARRANQRAVAQKRADRRGFHGRRHHYQPQIRPRHLLESPQQSQAQVSFQMPLVELVQHHGRYAVQARIGEQSAREHAFGHESQARMRAGHLLEAHLVAHRLAQTLAPLEGHPARGQSRRQPPRLQHQDLSAARSQQGRRNACRLPRPRRRFHHHVATVPQASQNLGYQRIDGQGQHGWRHSGLKADSGSYRLSSILCLNRMPHCVPPGVC